MFVQFSTLSNERATSRDVTRDAGRVGSGIIVHYLTACDDLDLSFRYLRKFAEGHKFRSI